MSSTQNRLRIILLYSIASFVGMLFGMWGFRAIAQEVFYKSYYYILMVCAMTIAIVIGFTLFAAVLAFVNEQTDSYIPLFPSVIALILAFQLPLQVSPEVRYFHRYRDDYETMVQLWQDGLITEDTPTETCIKFHQAVVTIIDDKEYCVLVGSWVYDESLVFFVYDPLEIILYTEYEPTSEFGHVCEFIYPYGGELRYQIDEHWSVCRLFLG